MISTKLISGFPGVGKSSLCKNYPNLFFDMVSTPYSKLNDGSNNPDFPFNYKEAIKRQLMDPTYKYIFISSHKNIRDMLKEDNILYTAIFPEKSLKEYYREIYLKRKDIFIDMIMQNWESFLDELNTEKNKFILTKENPHLNLNMFPLV